MNSVKVVKAKSEKLLYAREGDKKTENLKENWRATEQSGTRCY